MDRITTLRFIVPPIFCILFVLYPHSEEILRDIQLEKSGYATNTIIELLFGSTVVIITLGFFISSLTHLFLDLLKGNITRNFTASSENIKKYLIDKENINSQDNDRSKEVIEWKLHSAQEEYIQSQLKKRWEMAVTNFNVVVSLFLALLYNALFLGEALYKSHWLVLWVLVFLMPIFLYNGGKALNSIHKINQILERNFAEKV